MKIQKVHEICTEVLNEVSKVIVGKRDVLEKLLIAVLSNGHILIEDVPGLAKTLMAKTMAAALGCKFKRIQFTPDLLPADITGTYVFNQKTGDFELRKGPIFTNILLADEINRAPPKTQSALLEAMQEHQVTLDGRTHRLEDPFIVIATQNPLEFEGVYPLPEAQIDRFLMKIKVGYPSLEDEIEILRRRIANKSDEYYVNQVTNTSEVLEMQKAIEDVYVDESVLEYIVKIVRETRKHPRVEVGVSPRGAVALLKVSRARAVLNGRDYVTPDDVKSVALDSLSHRIILKTELWIRGADPRQIMREVLERVPVPKRFT